MKHVVVYREPNRYSGWPANYGIWSWGDEIVVGFTRGYYAPVQGHTRDKDKPFETMLSRSLDGGESWSTGLINCRVPGGRVLSADEHQNEGLRVAEVLEGPDGPTDSPGGFDFTHPDFALLVARTGLGAGTRAWFYVSFDRCRTWDGGYWLPMFGQLGVAARTDYIVNSSSDAHLFFTATRPDGTEGRCFCARTTDGGKNFKFVSWIQRNPDVTEIMPAAVRLSDSQLLVAVRAIDKRPGADPRGWIDLHRSEDDGATWRYESSPAPNIGSNPPTLTKLADGRLCLTYGYRLKPYGIRARLSEDGGRNWSEEIVLRDDAPTGDLGYPRTVQRPDGKIVTAYYYNDHPEKERFIAATIWQP